MNKVSKVFQFLLSKFLNEYALLILTKHDLLIEKLISAEELERRKGRKIHKNLFRLLLDRAQLTYVQKL